MAGPPRSARALAAAVVTASGATVIAACGTGAPPAPPVAGPASSTTAVVAVGPAVDIDIPVATIAPIDVPGAVVVLVDVPGATATLLPDCTLRVDVRADTIGFAQDSAELPDDGPGRDALEALLARFATAERVDVGGHTSTEGGAERNDPLSQDRADAVAATGRALLPDVEFVARGFGSTSTTVIEDGTEATRSRNRRVELSGRITTCQPQAPGAERAP